MAGLILLNLFSAVAKAQPVAAMPCEQGGLLQQSFPSGANWQVCAAINEEHGLQLSNMAYRAPGDTRRPVMKILHIGQLLLHLHDQQQPLTIIQPALSQPLSRRAQILPLSEDTCGGSILALASHPSSLCSEVRSNRILAKYAQRESVHSERWELSVAMQFESLVLATTVWLTEDGQIQPRLAVSGRLSQQSDDRRFAENVSAASAHFTRASLLSNWRLVFDVDSPAADQIEEFEFALSAGEGNRRPLLVRQLQKETLRLVDRERFRGWRIRDATGSGYYLDPANSGYSYRSKENNWAQYDVAFTRYYACERYAMHNPVAVSAEGSPGDASCGASLDDFINNEALSDAPITLWYNLARVLLPRNESWPAIASTILSFDLVPFDWTNASPFELISR